jgi:hypothetical protein
VGNLPRIVLESLVKTNHPLLAVFHQFGFGMPARIASVRARFVVRAVRVDERETNQRLTLWTRTKGSQRHRQEGFQHGTS